MFRPAVSTVVLLAALAVAGLCAAQPTNLGGQSAEPGGKPAIEVRHDVDRRVTVARIRADDGEVAWSDILRALARARGYDDWALEGVLPKGHFDISTFHGRLACMVANMALGPHVRLDVESPQEATDEPHLVIELDQEAMLASTRRFKAMLRARWLRRRPERQQKYGLVGPKGWEDISPQEDLVVFVHGFNSRPEELEGLVAAVRAKGFGCAGFRYPNDQPIVDSAKLLARELSQLAADHPGRGVSLVTHSMGALVAREAVENPDLDPGNVGRLIMVAPPNQGTGLARFAFALELWEHTRSESRRKEVGLLYAVVEDGLSEAAGDLRPDSPFLRKLNARPRNPKIRYSIFLGTKGPLQEDELKRLRDQVADANQKSRWVRFFGVKVHSWLEDLDEVVDAKGDGVVSVRRGNLEGVNDVVLCRFGHVGIVDGSGENEEEKVCDGILERLRRGS